MLVLKNYYSDLESWHIAKDLPAANHTPIQFRFCLTDDEPLQTSKSHPSSLFVKIVILLYALRYGHDE